MLEILLELLEVITERVARPALSHPIVRSQLTCVNGRLRIGCSICSSMPTMPASISAFASNSPQLSISGAGSARRQRASREARRGVREAGDFRLQALKYNALSILVPNGALDEPWLTLIRLIVGGDPGQEARFIVRQISHRFLGLLPCLESKKLLQLRVFDRIKRDRPPACNRGNVPRRPWGYDRRPDALCLRMAL